MPELTITVDTRERYPYKFTKQQASAERGKLPVGDYGVLHEGEVVARLQVGYPTVPIVFCETSPLAEEWTFRSLGAALAHHLDDPTDPAAPRAWRE